MRMFWKKLFVTFLVVSSLMCVTIALAEKDEAYAAYRDYLPEIPKIDNIDSMTKEERSLAFWKVIQDRGDELGVPYMDWSLADKAWFSKVAKAYDLTLRMEEFVMPTKDDLPEEEVVKKAKEAMAQVLDSDPNSLTVSILSFAIFNQGEEPIWYVRFGYGQEVRINRQGEIIAAQVEPTPMPAASQITFDQADQIVRDYLIKWLRFTPEDVEKMTIDPHYSKRNADNPCDYFLYHCYQGEEITSVYVNADTGEVYKIDLPGLGNG